MTVGEQRVIIGKEGIMELLQAIEARHAVRYFTEQPIEEELAQRLRQKIDECNSKSGLNIQLCLQDPRAFETLLARYGVFTNVNNYIAVVGKKNGEADEECGYYGEQIVLLAQQLGLNTCWVGGTYSKRKVSASVGYGEKIYLVIALGYGENQGKPHKTKPVETLCSVVNDEVPGWFLYAMEAVQMAPSAMNQQKYRFHLDGKTVRAEPGSGFYTKVDLGIAKLHFEIGAAAAGATEADWHWG